MANVMMTVQPAMKKTVTTMKPYKYVTDDNDDHDYDDTDNLCEQLNMNQYHNYTCRSIH